MTIDSQNDSRAGEDYTRPRPPVANLVPDLNGVNAFSTDKIAASVLATEGP